MVAAGVYLLARNEALLAGWPLETAGWIGATTAVLGALIALGERDLKRVLAGSTSSQLGLMLVGVAAGGPAVAVFHLAAHAAGKAAMFLAAGTFQHARGSTDLEDLRGIARAQPVAFGAFMLGAASIAAVPPLAAFWSKDAIVAAAETNPAWLVLVLLAGAGSAAYLLRPVLVLADRGAIAVGGSRVGAGGEREGRQAVAGTPPAARSVPPTMVGAAAVLAGLGVLLGALGAPLAGLLDAPAPETTLVSVAGSLLALVAGAAVVLRPGALAALGHAGTVVGAELLRGADALAGAVRLAARGVAAVDERVAVRLPDALARGAVVLSRGVDRADRGGLDAAVDGVGRGGLLAASASARVERGGIDAAVDGLARAVGRGGRGASAAQTGKLHEYLRDAVLGAAAIALLIALTALT
jgi:NADH-quinone oxidoreductase subunit L